MISPSCPQYYRMSETEDLNHWAARRLTEAAPLWSGHPDSTLLNVLWVEMLRYVVRLPFKGSQYAIGIAEPQKDYFSAISDARKAINLLRDIEKALSRVKAEGIMERGEPAAAPPARWGLYAAPGTQAIPDELRDNVLDCMQKWPDWYAFYYYPVRMVVDQVLARDVESHERVFANQISGGELARIVLNVDDKPPAPASELPCVPWEEITEQARAYIKEHWEKGQVWFQLAYDEGEAWIFTEEKTEKAEEYQGQGRTLRRITLPPAMPPTPLPTRWGMAASPGVQALPVRHVQEILWRSHLADGKDCAWYYRPETDVIYSVQPEDVGDHDKKYADHIATGTLCRVETKDTP